MMQSAGPRMLGQILVEEYGLSSDDMEAAITESKKSGERLGEILLKMNLIEEETLAKALGQQLSVPYVRISESEIDEETIRVVPPKMATHYQVMPIQKMNGTLRVAVTDPLDIHLLDDLRMILHTEVDLAIASDKEIREAIKKYYGIGADTMEGLMSRAGEAEKNEETSSENLEDMAGDASIVRFVNQIIQEAIGDRATDIHFEPMEESLRIRYRIDGVLYEAAIPPSIRHFQSAIISRIKIMADMNIAERRLPQDGKIKIKSADVDFDLRVSTVPTPYGESIAVRLLSRDSELVKLERLGLSSYHQEILRRMIHRPHGIVLVTGPTGSGKSTTLYAALTEINDTAKKIMTIEDPIEYRIHGVTQIQVSPKIGLTFASVLRTLLRQDPDVIMVGETRDPETAEITIRTALTGHLVFSTLHTNDACGAISRLLDMGIEPFLISSSLEGMIAQRLVRVLCPDCKTAYDPPEREKAMVNMAGEDMSDVTFYRNRGCETCRYTGYHGRTAIYEIVQITETLRRMIIDRKPANLLKKEAMSAGMRPLRHDGWGKIKAGVTTIEEVLRVTLEDEVLLEDEFDQTETPAIQEAK